MKKNNLLLKSSLLSICLVTASLNAIAGIIPDIAASFPNTPLYVIELMTTIPSLTSMLAIICSGQIRKLLGQKNTIVFSTLLCGVFGILPFFIRQIYAMLIFRAAFGFGVGCLSSTLLILIIYFFDGDERSQMIGLQGSIGGLGSMLTTFVAGKLVVLGWPASFFTYLVSFLVFAIVFMFIPKVHIQEESKGSKQQVKVNWKYIIYYSLLSFVSMLLATFFVIKCSTLILINQFGTIQDGSMLVMLISAGSLIAGAAYGSINKQLKDKSLVVFYILTAISFIFGGLASNLFTMMIASFILGFGLMAFVPFLQEKAGEQGDKGTQTLLVLQSLGAFLAPYVGTFLNVFTQSLNMQFIICGIFYFVLTAVFVLFKVEL